MTIRGLRKNGNQSPGSGIRNSNPYLNRYGAWGISQEAHSDDHSADVLTDSGVLLYHVPVSSREWVKDEDAYTSGQRDLPPAGSRVFVMMPTGNFDGCFVLCSGFVVIDQAQKQAFMAAGKEKIRKRVFPGNWKEEYDCATGTHSIVSPDDKTSFIIDYGTADESKDPPELHMKLFDNIKADIVSDDSIKLSVFDEVKIEHKKDDSAKVTIFDTELTIKKGEVSIKPKKTTIEVDGDATIKTSGNTTVESTGDVSVKGKNVSVEAATKATIKAADASITGGKLTVNGSSAPSTGPFCGIPNCLFTGAPHGGNMVTGT
jgi:hypothetical protein